ncbi:hypothetical protein P4O66_004038 [Electrophorus voltai]|uniref:Uncharacterized protein n=1 Tax=Electrophorus voltai TaxID=2609070 RepID=A0AAD9E5T2_9TELE|nr:hypothetical protein P4O66_004038 [Electrophorus voltai]
MAAAAAFVRQNQRQHARGDRAQGEGRGRRDQPAMALPGPEGGRSAGGGGGASCRLSRTPLLQPGSSFLSLPVSRLKDHHGNSRLPRPSPGPAALTGWLRGDPRASIGVRPLSVSRSVCQSCGTWSFDRGFDAQQNLRSHFNFSRDSLTLPRNPPCPHPTPDLELNSKTPGGNMGGRNPWFIHLAVLKSKYLRISRSQVELSCSGREYQGSRVPAWTANELLQVAERAPGLSRRSGPRVDGLDATPVTGHA